MKILLRPSDTKAQYAAPIISITTNHDDHTLSEVLENLIVPALVAYGFHPDSIQNGFRDHEVPGAKLVIEIGEPSGSCDMFEVPEDFVYAGFDTEVDGVFDEEDVVFRLDLESAWENTPYLNGQEVFYAVREGSPAHKAILASL